MTYLEALQLLPEEIRDKAIHNTKLDRLNLDWENHEVGDRTQPEILVTAFLWEFSPEGQDFWNEWYEKLKKDEVLQSQDN